MSSTRLTLALIFALLLAVAPVPAGARPEGATVDRDLRGPARIELKAGEFAAFRWQPQEGVYRVEHLPPSPAALPDPAEAAVGRAPKWLGKALRSQLRELVRVPVRATEGPARLGRVGDLLLVQGEDGRIREFEIGTFTERAERSAREGEALGARSLWLDVTGDGIPDHVRGRDDGSVAYRPARGPAPRQSAPALTYRFSPSSFAPAWRGSAIRPAAAGGSLYLGDLEGRLVEFRRDGAEWLEPIFIASPDDAETGLFASPAAGQLNGSPETELVVGREDGTFRLLFDGLGPIDPGFDVGDFSSPCLADLNGDGDLDLISGNGEGRIIVYPRVGPPNRKRFAKAETPAGLAAIDVGDSSAPAAGDVNGDGVMDLVVGNQEGELFLFLGPEFKEVEGAFEGLDLGELAAPAFLDGDLVVGNLDGQVLRYELDYAEGKLRFTERDSWRFQPDRDAADLEAYYARRYFREDRELLGASDPETRDAYVALLAGAPEELVDEIAFSIAHTPVEVLRAMARLDQAKLLLDNARAVYEMAGTLPYVRIEELVDRTTLAYRTAEGGEVVAPAEVYYWWVVHPRILYEIPLRIDASFWDVSAADRGLTDSEWWKTKPERDIHDPAGKGVFWREGLVTDNRFGKSLMEVVGSAETLEDALTGIHEFLAHNADGVALMRFGYETQDLQPWQIYAKHYGSCGEHSIIGAACARTMLLPMSVISDRGEDHQWNEWWGTDGHWHHVDFCGRENIDRPWGSTEGRQHQGKTVSSVTRWRGDDLLDTTTATVFSPEPDYTARGTGYTDVAEVRVIVADPRGRPVDGALVIVRSHWNKRNMISVWGYTGGDGAVSFDLGYEPNGGYTFEALTPLGAAGVTNFPVRENESYELRLTTPDEKPTFATEKRFTSPAAGAEGADSLTAKVTSARIRPPNLVTSGRYRIGSWLTERVDYRGTRTHDVPVAAGEQVEVLVFDPAEYRRFVKGGLCAPLERRPLGAGGPVGFAAGREREHVVVISNLSALFLEATVEIAPHPDSIPEIVPPEIAWPAGTKDLTVSSGARVRFAGRVTNPEEAEGVFIHSATFADGIPRRAEFDPRSGRFSFEIDAGEGGPLPPGHYPLTARAIGVAGVDGVSAPLMLKVTPARVYRDQVIHQDDPDDPLARCSWILGPYVIGEGERFLLIRTESVTPDFDMDMHLYFDRNGNGRIDGVAERIAQSTSPTANERIYMRSPKAGTYWLYCQGFSLEGEEAKLDVEVFPLGAARSVVDLTPAGRGRTAPKEFSGRFLPFAGIDPASVQIKLDGEDVTYRSEVTALDFTLPLSRALATDVEHTLRVRAKHRSGREEIYEWTFLTDTRAPTLKLLPTKGSVAAGSAIEIEAEATEEGPGLLVAARRAGEKERRLKPVKNRPGAFTLKLDTKGWTPGEHFLLVTARDAVGNETEAVLTVRVT
jgi:FG-GAP-like repeat